MSERRYDDLTVKRLFGLSGNTCAHPECNQALIDILDGKVNVSVIAHIEGLNPKSARHNEKMTTDEKNSYNNLILLCQTHAKAIDSKDTNGEYRYSRDDLLKMKQEHEDAFESSRQMIYGAKAPSILAELVQKLALYQGDLPKTKVPKEFKPEEKMTFNKVDRHYGLIQKYKVYHVFLDRLYNQFEAQQQAAILDVINDLYIEHCRPNKASDDVWDEVESKLVKRLVKGAGSIYTEQLEWCVKIIMVDGFMRCKILEEPEKEDPV